MKKSLVILFSALLLSSVCFAQEVPVTTPSTQEKLTEKKKQDTNKKLMNSNIKRSEKKVKKVKKINEPAKQ